MMRSEREKWTKGPVPGKEIQAMLIGMAQKIEDLEDRVRELSRRMEQETEMKKVMVW